MIEKTDWVTDIWNTELYQFYKKENFDNLDKLLTQRDINPKTILDIGCGFAWESRMFYEKYASDLWLLDGDASTNQNKSGAVSDTGYHKSSEEFLYYYPLQKLDEELSNANVKGYNLVDCNNIQIPENVKFDLITSWISCGFHYPVSTYKNLILKHSHPDTVVVMDLRVKAKSHYPVLEEGVEILDILQRRRKYFTCLIKFV